MLILLPLSFQLFNSKSSFWIINGLIANVNKTNFLRIEFRCKSIINFQLRLFLKFFLYNLSNNLLGFGKHSEEKIIYIFLLLLSRFAYNLLHVSFTHCIRNWLTLNISQFRNKLSFSFWDINLYRTLLR